MGASFAERIKARRKELGLSLRDVEATTKSRVSNAYLSQLENGKIASPSANTVYELSAAYGLPIDHLISWLEIESDTPAPVLCPTCGRAMLDRNPNHDQ